MNVLNIILFIFWIAAAVFIYLKWFQKNSSNWNPSMLIAGFSFKILLGCLYGFVFKHYYHGDDTWLFHQQSVIETSNLLNQPIEFLKSLFIKGNLERYEMNSFWKEMEYTIFIKILAIFNLFSGSNYYINIILYGSITFSASIMLINLFSKFFPERRNIYCIIFFFFVPFVFWTSGIRREGFIVLFMAHTIFYFSSWLKHKKYNHLIASFITLLLLGIFRYSFAFSVIVLFILWQVLDWSKKKWSPLKTTIVVSLISVIIFFSTNWFGPINLPGMIIKQQEEFMLLKGGSYLQMKPLKNDISSFLQNLPSAIDHVLLRPYPWEKGSLLIHISKIESWFVIILILLFVFSKPKWHQLAFAVPILLFIILNYLMLGYTVPFLGAIVRYRVIHEAILVAWIFSYFDYRRSFST